MTHNVDLNWEGLKVMFIKWANHATAKMVESINAVFGVSQNQSSSKSVPWAVNVELLKLLGFYFASLGDACLA